MLHILNYTLLTVLTVNLLATSGDITMTWTSPMLPKLYSNNTNINPFGKPITSNQDSWIGSLINVGAMVGPFPFGFIAEKFGRKIALLTIAIPHIISYLLLAVSKTVYLYYFARFLGGVAVGGGYTLLPMYVAEISEDSNRGFFSSSLNIFWTFGNLLPYLLGPYLSVFWFNIILAVIPTLFFGLCLLIAPESPYYLIGKNRRVEAEKSLLELREYDKNIVEKEIQQIQTEIAQNDDQIGFYEFLQSTIYRKGLYISLILIMFNQLSGINAVLFYTEEIFQAAGSTKIPPHISSMIIGFVIFFSSFGSPFFVDQWGRRFLMLISTMGLTVSNLCFGVFFYLKSSNVDVSGISWLPLVSLIGYIVMFNVGLGALPWTISSELFPTNVKSYAATLISCVCWTTSFVVTKFYNDLQNLIGVGETFWLFGIFCFLAFSFTVFYVPETKGRSFQEIQEILKQESISYTIL